MATWPSGKAEACKAFTPSSNLGVASNAALKREYADMAQLVEHHLAKVGVAGSNPVFRFALAIFSRGGGTGRRTGLKILR